MTLPKELTTVTRLSKVLAFILFITLPILGFFLGIRYEKIDTAITTLEVMYKNKTYTRILIVTPTLRPTPTEIIPCKSTLCPTGYICQSVPVCPPSQEKQTTCTSMQQECIKRDEKRFCNIDTDCVKYSSCSEECVNKIYAKDNPPDRMCGKPWFSSCSCENHICID